MWTVEAEKEVEDWLRSLDPKQLARTQARIDRLKAEGNALRLPSSKPLKDGLFELRFTLGDTERRITYRFAAERRIILLTTFTKQRSNEKAQIKRAREVLKQSIRAEDSQT